MVGNDAELPNKAQIVKTAVSLKIYFSSKLVKNLIYSINHIEVLVGSKKPFV